LSWVIYYCLIEQLVWSEDPQKAKWPPAEMLDLLRVMAAVQVIR
jgi:hypothetical protein